MARILVLRGGAIGDFILTLPALGLLREGFPDCHIEVMSYRRVLPLVEGRYYANSVRCIEYGPLAACFNPKAPMDATLRDLFLGTDRIISFLHDPDHLFQTALRQIGANNFLPISPILGKEGHAARQLAAPLTTLGLYLEDPSARIFLQDGDHTAAAEFLREIPGAFFAIHPGSGGSHKNWPLDHWEAIIHHLLHCYGDGNIVLIAGEADKEALALATQFENRLRTFRGYPLNILAAVLSKARGFMGHDSGISHLAAATGIPCLLLFGPTDPVVWAPTGLHVRVLRAPAGDLRQLTPGQVRNALSEATQPLPSSARIKLTQRRSPG